MIQPLSSHGGLFQAHQLSTRGGAEKPGELENDGDSDDGAAGGTIARSPTLSGFPNFMGTKINTLA